MRVSTDLLSSRGRGSVLVPALAGLAAQLASLDLCFQLRRRLVALVAGRPVSVHARVVSDVEAAEVPQPKWTQRPVETLFDGGVDVFEAGDACVEEGVRLLRGCMEDPVDDKTVDRLVDEHWGTTHLAREAKRARHSRLGRQGTTDDLDQVHD